MFRPIGAILVFVGCTFAGFSAASALKRERDLLRAFAVYLYYHKQIPYERFYDGIIDYCEDHPELVLLPFLRQRRYSLYLSGYRSHF